MKILLATDAWTPQVNGVVRTLTELCPALEALGHEVTVIGPERFRTVPAPTCPEVRLSVDALWRLPAMIDAAAPDAIHVPTEGPIGWAARRYCLRRGLPFTSSFHTRFPEYLRVHTGIPSRFVFAGLRRFHSRAVRTMVVTESLQRELTERGFPDVVRWPRGVDTQLFRPREDSVFDLPRPVWLYVGRLSAEKNIGAFLDLDLHGSKVVVGDGPQRAGLERKYPQAHFLGYRRGEDLARHFASADALVFPSRIETYGIVLLEALACGLPVAAYPVPGPSDIVDGHGIGCLDEDLARAARSALEIPRAKCRAYAERFTWETSARVFVGNLAPIRAGAAG